mmetsp:Transcript_13602/g.25946  ORF Transcript_13602/g.25946 Transcript_13602/m.25946 type:complete len:272 (+) Transcript_13602:843-1658(+)
MLNNLIRGQFRVAVHDKAFVSILILPGLFGLRVSHFKLVKTPAGKEVLHGLVFFTSSDADNNFPHATVCKSKSNEKVSVSAAAEDWNIGPEVRSKSFVANFIRDVLPSGLHDRVDTIMGLIRARVHAQVGVVHNDETAEFLLAGLLAQGKDAKSVPPEIGLVILLAVLARIRLLLVKKRRSRQVRSVLAREVVVHELSTNFALGKDAGMTSSAKFSVNILGVILSHLKDFNLALLGKLFNGRLKLLESLLIIHWFHSLLFRLGSLLFVSLA